jgi:hypothetical protein
MKDIFGGSVFCISEKGLKKMSYWLKKLRR